MRTHHSDSSVKLILHIPSFYKLCRFSLYRFFPLGFSFYRWFGFIKWQSITWPYFQGGYVNNTWHIYIYTHLYRVCLSGRTHLQWKAIMWYHVQICAVYWNIRWEVYTSSMFNPGWHNQQGCHLITCECEITGLVTGALGGHRWACFGWHEHVTPFSWEEKGNRLNDPKPTQ